MKKVFSFVKGKRDDRRDAKINPTISVEITNPSGQKITSDDEHIVGLQQGYGYNIDLSGKDKGMPKLHKAVWVGNIEKVKIHAKKLDINLADSLNRTPLHLAVAQGHTEIAWFLLNSNASVDVIDGEGLTPFLKAIECGNKDCVNLLIECGVHVNCIDRNGNNGLHLASRHGFYNIASLLLKEGVSHDFPNNVGEFPMHIATGCEHRDLVELLLRSGASVEAQDRERRTPLMLAARAGLHTIVKLLLDHGALLQASDSNGWTAEDYAQFGGHQDLVELLRAGLREENDQALNEQGDRLSVQSSDTSETVPQPQPNGIEQGSEEPLDSPRSCVTPPALEPPRSWDLIQSGAIDQGADGKRRSLMTLGTLRSHQDSFADCSNEHGTKTPEPTPMMLPSPTGDCLSLEHRLSPVPVSELMPTPERRTRSPLERANSLDLPSDQDSPIQMGPGGGTFSPVFNEVWEPSPKYPSININDQNPDSLETNVINILENNNNLTLEKLDNTAENITININESLNEASKEQENSEELVSNENYRHTSKDSDNAPDESKTNDLTGTDRLSSMDCSDSLDNLDEKSSGTDNFYAGASSSLDNLDDVPDKRMSIEIIQSTGKLDDTLSICTIPVKGKFRESHSLDILEASDSTEESARHSKGKKHARNKSITLAGQPPLWKSVDALPKHACGERNNDIDAQLQCYDEALRQLASIPKPPRESLMTAEDISGPATITLEKADETLAAMLPEVDAEQTNEPSEPMTNPGLPDFHCEPVSLDPENIEAPIEPKRDLENDPSGLDSEKDEGFPPPPKCFMENEDDITHLNTVEIINNASLPLSKLTPIKENYLELDSLTSNIDALDSDTTENSVSKQDSTPCHFNIEVIVNSSSQGMGVSPVVCPIELDSLSDTNTLEQMEDPNQTPETEYNDLEIFKPNYFSDTANIVSCHLDGGDLFLTDQVLPEYYDRYFVDVKALHLNPNGVDMEQIVLPPDSPSPKGGRRLRKGSSEGDVGQGYTHELPPKCSSLDFDIGGICNVSKVSTLVQMDKSDSECECGSRPLRRKRKMLAAMRSPGVGSDDNDDDSTEDDPPFWQSTEKGGHFTRQETVVLAVPSSHASRNTIRDNNINAPGTSQIKHEGDKNSTPESSDAETASVADTPQHIYTPKGHQSVLQVHLREANLEKGRLEETAANLREKAERLKYELADARQAEVARDDTISILQAQLKRLEERYTKAQDDLLTLRQRATNAEHELQHLRQLCTTLREEKAELNRELSKHVNCQPTVNYTKDAALNISQEELLTKFEALERQKNHEEEKNTRLKRHLEEVLASNQKMLAEREALTAQNIADVLKLQEDTLCWKERYEECAAKLELMDKRQDPRLIEAQDTIATLKRTISILQQEKATLAKLTDDLEYLSTNGSQFFERDVNFFKNFLQTLTSAISFILENGPPSYSSYYDEPAPMGEGAYPGESYEVDNFYYSNFDTLYTNGENSTHYCRLATALRHVKDRVLEGCLIIENCVAALEDMKCFSITEMDDFQSTFEKEFNKLEKKPKQSIFSENYSKRKLTCTHLENYSDVNKKNSNANNLGDCFCINKTPKNTLKYSQNGDNESVNNSVSSLMKEIRSQFDNLKSTLSEISEHLKLLNDESLIVNDKFTQLHDENLGKKILKKDDKEPPLLKQSNVELPKVDHSVKYAPLPQKRLHEMEKSCNTIVEQMELLNNRVLTLEKIVKKLQHDKIGKKSELGDSSVKETEFISKCSCRIELVSNSSSNQHSQNIEFVQHNEFKTLASSESVSNVSKHSSDISVPHNYETTRGKGKSRNKPDDFKYPKAENKSTLPLKIAKSKQRYFPIKSWGQNEKCTRNTSEDISKEESLERATKKKKKKKIVKNGELSPSPSESVLSSNESSPARRKYDTSIKKSVKYSEEYEKFEYSNNHCTRKNCSLLHELANIQKILGEGNSNDQKNMFMKQMEENDSGLDSTSTHQGVEFHKDASTSTNSPRKSGHEEEAVEKGKCRPDNSMLKVIQQELNSIRQQLELNSTHGQVVFDDMEPTQKKVFDLQQKLEIETGKRYALDLQVKRLLNELQEKLELEAELDRMHQRLDRDFVSKQELQLLTSKQDEAIVQIKQQTLLVSETKIGEKLAEINKLLHQQMQEQARIDRDRVSSELSLKQELEQTKHKLQIELTKVHATLKAKEAEEKLLREKCEQLAREVDRIQDLRRKSLIEKSYSVNLSDLSPSRSKPDSSLRHCSLVFPQNSHEPDSKHLKEQLDNTIRKHNSGFADVNKIQSSLSLEEKVAEDLKLKYLKH